MRASITIGGGYGDEGKGSFVNYLCGIGKNPLVIRFNGGQQTGHTVVYNNTRHVFSNFGSGTLKGIPTYWSEYCTVSPMGIYKEGNALREKYVTPVIYFNANAMVTTPFDIFKNHMNEKTNQHGTVGVGFGTTIQRNEDHYHLYVRDLQYPAIRDEKLRLIIENYYGYSGNLAEAAQKIVDDFKRDCDDLVSRYKIVNNLYSLSQYDHLIFEGGQGILLDMKYGFFPNVTRSNTTSENALKIIETLKIPSDNLHITTYYITRAYQTRHGNGYMTNIDLDTSYIIENPLETNVNGGLQGEFRKSVLDLDLLKYAVECDKYHNPDSRKVLVITCLDQISTEKIPVTQNGELCMIPEDEIGINIGVYNSLYSRSDRGVVEHNKYMV